MEPEGNCTERFITSMLEGSKPVMAVLERKWLANVILMQNLMHQGSAHVFFIINFSLILIVLLFYFTPYMCVSAVF